VTPFKTFRKRCKRMLKPHGRRVLPLFEATEGQITFEEARFLYAAARGKRVIVEIGSFRGQSCVMLAKGALDGGVGEKPSITAIDPHLKADDNSTSAYAPDDAAVFEQTVAKLGVSDVVRHVVKPSREARLDWPETRAIDLLWIDGDHSYEAVKADLADWTPLLAPGGVVACHDYTSREGVRRAWDENMHDPRFRIYRPVRSIAWAQRNRQP